MEASTLITECVLNDGMAALLSELGADEYVAAITADGLHHGLARVGTRVVSGTPDGLDVHNHGSEDIAHGCLVGSLALALVEHGGTFTVITPTDGAALTAEIGERAAIAQMNATVGAALVDLARGTLEA